MTARHIDAWGPVDAVTWLNWWQDGISGWPEADILAARRVLRAVDLTRQDRLDDATAVLCADADRLDMQHEACVVVYLIAEIIALNPDREGFSHALVLDASAEHFALVAELVGLANALIDECIIRVCKMDVPVEQTRLYELVTTLATPRQRHMMLGIRMLAYVSRERPDILAAFRRVFTERASA